MYTEKKLAVHVKKGCVTNKAPLENLSKRQ